MFFTKYTFASAHETVLDWVVKYKSPILTLQAAAEVTQKKGSYCSWT